VLAWLLAGNMIAAAIGTAVGNPLTFPAIWAATHGTGSAILGMTEGDHTQIKLGSMFHHGAILDIWDPILKPMLVGGVPLGLVCGGILYVLTRAAVSAFQHRRRSHFESRQPIAENPEVEA